MAVVVLVMYARCRTHRADARVPKRGVGILAVEGTHHRCADIPRPCGGDGRCNARRGGPSPSWSHCSTAIWSLVCDRLFARWVRPHRSCRVVLWPAEVSQGRRDLDDLLGFTTTIGRSLVPDVVAQTGLDETMRLIRARHGKIELQDERGRVSLHLVSGNVGVHPSPAGLHGVTRTFDDDASRCMQQSLSMPESSATARNSTAGLPSLCRCRVISERHSMTTL